MTFDSWSAIDLGDSVIRNRKITTVVLSNMRGMRSRALIAFSTVIRSIWPESAPAKLGDHSVDVVLTGDILTAEQKLED